jgi:hypothetical protein
LPSLNQFARNIRRRGQSVPAQVDRIVKKAAGAALQSVVSATPVDTGRARGGWQVGAGIAPQGESNRLDPGGGGTIGAGLSKVRSARPGQTVFISNNVDYIGFLNQGSSSQAPANFVGIAVRKAASVIRGEKVFKR